MGQAGGGMMQDGRRHISATSRHKPIGPPVHSGIDFVDFGAGPWQSRVGISSYAIRLWKEKYQRFFFYIFYDVWDMLLLHVYMPLSLHPNTYKVEDSSPVSL